MQKNGPEQDRQGEQETLTFPVWIAAQQSYGSFLVKLLTGPRYVALGQIERYKSLDIL